MILNRGQEGGPANISITVRDFGVHDLMGFFDIRDVLLDKMYYAVAIDDVFSVVVNPNSVAILWFYSTRE